MIDLLCTIGRVRRLSKPPAEYLTVQANIERVIYMIFELQLYKVTEQMRDMSYALKKCRKLNNIF